MAFFIGLLTIGALSWGLGWLFGIPYLLDIHHSALVAAAVMFILIGFTHLRKPEQLTYMIANFLPNARALVLLSGVAEILLGTGLLIPATQALAAWGLITLLVLIFPANINVAINQLPPPGGLPAKPWYVWSRLLFQPVYAAWIGYAALY